MTLYIACRINDQNEIIHVFPKAYKMRKNAEEHVANWNRTSRHHDHIIIAFNGEITLNRLEGSALRNLIGKDYRTLY